MIVPKLSDDPEDVAWRNKRAREIAAEAELAGIHYATERDQPRDDRED